MSNLLLQLIVYTDFLKLDIVFLIFTSSINITDIIMTCATFFLVIITGYYAYITSIIAKTASKQLKLSQRPYVNIDDITESPIPIDKSFHSIAVKYSNKCNVTINIENIVVLVDNIKVENIGKTKILVPERKGIFYFHISS